MQLPPITRELPAANRPFSRSIRLPGSPASYAAFRLFHGEEPPTLSIKDQVAVAVAERIIDGRFGPSERIPEQLLADEFNVSKAPVSEALMLLEYAGLVESAARRSAYVPRMNRQDFDDLSEHRSALIRVALGRFFDRHGPADRSMLQAYHAEMEAMAGNDARSFDFVEVFDRATLYAVVRGGNQRVTRSLFALSLQVLRYYRLGVQTLKQRRAMLASLKQGVLARDANDKKKYLAICDEIHRMRYDETVAALKAAA
jgi:DNA-binding GntR family transcriptional regulator